jgi:transposase
MTEIECFEQILDLKEIQIERIDWQKHSIHIYCSSSFEEAICPHCIKKTNVIHQKYERQFRDLPITGKEVHLHLHQRRFYCSDCNKYFNERFSFVDSNRKTTRRYERHVYEYTKNSTPQKISAQENLSWHTVNEIHKRWSSEEIASRHVGKVRVIGMDEFAVKKGHRNYATVIVDLERVEIIDILDYREQKKLIDYFENRGADWCKEIEVFCSDMWRGFFGTAKSVFPNATLVVDRFHFFGYLNKAIDNERKALRRKFKTQEEFKRLKWALLKDPTDLTDTQKNKLDKVFLLCPQLKLLYNQKEKIRFIFNKRLTHEQGEIELNKWIDEAKKLNNRYLNTFLEMLNNWKEYLLNYFSHRFTTSIIEGINNTIKTVKRMGYGFRNFGNFKLRILTSFA